MPKRWTLAAKSPPPYRAEVGEEEGDSICRCNKRSCMESTAGCMESAAGCMESTAGCMAKGHIVAVWAACCLAHPAHGAGSGQGWKWRTVCAGAECAACAHVTPLTEADEGPVGALPQGVVGARHDCQDDGHHNKALEGGPQMQHERYALGTVDARGIPLKFANIAALAPSTTRPHTTCTWTSRICVRCPLPGTAASAFQALLFSISTKKADKLASRSQSWCS